MKLCTKLLILPCLLMSHVLASHPVSSTETGAIHNQKFHVFKSMLLVDNSQPYDVSDYNLAVHFNESAQANLLSDLSMCANIFNAQNLKGYGVFDGQLKVNGQLLQLHREIDPDDSILNTWFKGRAVQTLSNQTLSDRTWYRLNDDESQAFKALVIDDIGYDVDDPDPMDSNESILLVPPFLPASLTTFFQNLHAFIVNHPLDAVNESFSGHFEHNVASARYERNLRFLSFLYNPDNQYQVKLYAKDGASITLHDFNLEIEAGVSCVVNLKQTIRLPGAASTTTDTAFPCLVIDLPPQS
ncbi:MAG: hypothetical protein ISP86_01810 [Shewanellaceae bacterium]|nr:hypothetical protein [Shewanellaceae bacterium]